MIPYVRFEYEECVDSKKNILSTQMNLLNSIKKLESYTILRKQELIKKTLLKNELKQAISQVNLVLSSIPSSQTSIKTVKQSSSQSAEIIINSKKSQDIESQLYEIREKLSKL